MLNRRKSLRLAWVIGDWLQRNTFLTRTPKFTGGSSLIRYQWYKEYLHLIDDQRIQNILYRPWCTYDGIVFQKSMGRQSMELLKSAKNNGKIVIFDANTNYYESFGSEYYDGMLPSSSQIYNAQQITAASDAVIADSMYIAQKCREYNNATTWIPDSVRMDLVPMYRPWSQIENKIKLLWCGESIKLFELLAIEKPLIQYNKHIELVVVANSLQSINRWKNTTQDRFRELCKNIDIKYIPYRSISELFKVYSSGGVFISPRFLDNSYNLGHTEWKITLPMACGRVVLCSNVPSYMHVSSFSENCGIHICNSDEDWCHYFDKVLSGNLEFEEEEVQARAIVENNYSTSVVAMKYSEYLLDRFGSKYN